MTRDEEILLNAHVNWLNLHLMLLHAEMLPAGEHGCPEFIICITICNTGVREDGHVHAHAPHFK